MALVVEDGTGRADADALITLASANAYHAAQGNASWTGSDADKETAIRRASAHLTNSYGWQGLRRNGRDQSLAWPRVGVVDAEGLSIAIDEVPVEVKNACAEIALRELVSPGTLNPDFTPSEMIKREKIGPMETEYENARLDADAARPVLLIVRDMISQFLAAGSGSMLAGSTYRT